MRADGPPNPSILPEVPEAARRTPRQMDRVAGDGRPPYRRSQPFDKYRLLTSACEASRLLSIQQRVWPDAPRCC